MSNLKFLLKKLEGNEQFKKLTESLKQDQEPGTRQLLVLTADNFRPFLIASLFERLNQPLLVVTSSAQKGERLASDVSCFLPDDKVFYYPDWGAFPYERISPDREGVVKRLKILHLLSQERRIVVVASIQASMRRLPPVDHLPFKPFKIEQGKQVDLNQLAEWLDKSGYQRAPLVEAEGEFALRGGIIDVFPLLEDYPLRVEFFGDLVESIRSFSPIDQSSIEQKRKVTIFSSREILITNDLAKRLSTWLEEGLNFNPRWFQDVEKLEQQIYFDGILQYLPLSFHKLSSLFDYFKNQPLVILDETEQLKSAADRFSQQALTNLEKAVALKQAFYPPAPYYFNWDEISSLFNQSVSLNSFKSQGSFKQVFRFKSLPVQIIPGNLESLRGLLFHLKQKNCSSIILFNKTGTAKRFKELFSDWEIETADLSKAAKGKLQNGKIHLALGNLSKGFIFDEANLSLLSEADFLPRARRYLAKKLKPSSFALRLSDLSSGDYVVHQNYGIAKYQGLVREKVGEAVWDCLLLKYADGNLKVRTDQVNRVSRYIGASTEKPLLSKLGTSRWQKTKRAVKQAVKDLAISLLKLYAKRQSSAGFSFSKDSVWQKELEDSFVYEETPDQAKTIEEVKRDMELSRPMDRLVCGDVGYGKTEVALRASFKAVLDSKQVMILAPTTILAQQHYTTLSERLSPFPVKVSVLSRFKKAYEQRKTINDFERGRVDILIGTHRLLQKDVKPRNLGLVVVDEEQRFGVAHKEHLRFLEPSVDVLTLSATPIPRTLQASLAGARDLSVIETPPQGRLAVLTFVGEHNDSLIEIAIYRELLRGGQVYYVHNRVETIDKAASRIRKLVPEAKLAVAHGELNEKDLERVMLNFLEKKYDVLISTTIIESGIDIPSVNTVVVEGAENLGLAQLHQLRGRVGRKDVQAYAYFFFTPNKSLTATALERLKTISEFAELSSGFKIAWRDLEIRGAGNLLGKEQHGHLQAVGFELYCELLKEEVAKLQRKPIKKEKEVKINLPLAAFIPESYVPEETLRIEAYRRILAISSLEEAKEVASDLRDRYGLLPLEVENLVSVAKLRVLARKIGLSTISLKKGKIFLEPVELSADALGLLKKNHYQIVYKKQDRCLQVSVKPEPRAKTLFFLEKIFNDIMQVSEGWI